MITIRKYTEQDAKPTWLLFFNTIRNINKQDYNSAQLKAWAPESMDLFIWNKRMSDIEPFIAEIEGKIVGYADLQADGLIDHFFCDQFYQRQGVGKALMMHIFQTSRAKNIKYFFALVSITAKPFFEHFGFKVKKEESVELGEQTLICFQMEKRVDTEVRRMEML
ncbi:GNAT family N-acetyltransferase [Psychromonas antarctica]|nr:GNAT family N-acetyltransferase [Psychromonas antarctica]MCG6200649.1 GNAT family N-acetyltransferase [Psychromonas antarctica]